MVPWSGSQMDDVFLRYYVGHKGRFGHEFLEFELCPDGRLRYANNSNYKRDVLIRKELRVGRIVRDQIVRMLTEAGVLLSSQNGDNFTGLDDKMWPAPNRDGRQELEVIANGEHILFRTCKIGSLLDIQSSGDPEGLKAFHYLVQDLKTLVLYIIAAHFKIKPI
jgi:protein mago nashi